MATKLDSRQVKKRIALPKLGAAAEATVEVILDKINIEVDSPLRITASTTPDAVLNFSSSLIAASDGANKVVSPVKKLIFPGLISPTINFQTQALSNAADFDITWGTATLSQFRFATFTLIGTGKIKVTFSAEYASEAALVAAVNPGSLYATGGLPIGYVTLQATNASPAAYKTSGSATNIIENAKVYRFGSGGGGGSGTTVEGMRAYKVDGILRSATDTLITNLEVTTEFTFTKIRVEVTQVFDGTPTLEVGIPSDHDYLFTNADIDLTSLGIYEISVSNELAATDDIRCYITSGGTTGIVNVTVFGFGE